jgi:ubiquitin C-terminal hydrolase
MWNCPHCEKKVNAFKKINIWIPSKVMIVHIKRFIHKFTQNGYSASKLNNKVEYPITDFNINSYMSEYSSKMANYSYDLYGVANHVGNMNGGHYFSYTKSITDNKWYCLDDSTVSLIPEEDIVTKNAYMLFYRLKE